MNKNPLKSLTINWGLVNIILATILLVLSNNTTVIEWMQENADSSGPYYLIINGVVVWLLRWRTNNQPPVSFFSKSVPSRR